MITFPGLAWKPLPVMALHRMPAVRAGLQGGWGDQLEGRLST